MYVFLTHYTKDIQVKNEIHVPNNLKQVLHFLSFKGTGLCHLPVLTSSLLAETLKHDNATQLFLN